MPAGQESIATKPFAGASLCIVGNINRDVKSAPIASGEHLFNDGETASPAIWETIGGGGANSACAAAALGARTVFLGRVGADGLADRLSRTLSLQGVEPRMKRGPEPTGTSIALAYTSLHRHFISCLPASRALCFEDLDLQAFDGCDHLLRADVWFSEPMLFGGNERLLHEARTRGMTTSLDLNWDPHWGRSEPAAIAARKQAVRDTLKWVDLAHGNERELLEFCDCTDLQTALKRLDEWGIGAVVVHLGARGAGYWSGGELIVEPPAPISARVNAAGSGDVLSVCMMLLHNRESMSIPQRLRISNQIVAEFIEGRRSLIPPLAD